MARKYFIKTPETPVRNFFLSLHRKEVPPFPDTVLLETQSGCNGFCVFCPYEEIKDSMPKGRMDDDLFERIVDELGRHKAKKVIPCFINEPLLDKMLLERLAHIRARTPSTEISLTTNASVLTGEKARRIIGNDLADEINISFQGISRETYERSMKGLSFARTMENVRTLLTLRGKRKRPRVTITSVETHVVEKELARAAGFWRALGTEFRSLRFETRSGDVDEGLVPHRRHLMPFPFCRRPFNTMVITFDGLVPICCVDYTRKTVLGDAKKTSLSEIWNGQKFLAVRKAFIEGRGATIAACRDCRIAEK